MDVEGQNGDCPKLIERTGRWGASYEFCAYKGTNAFFSAYGCNVIFSVLAINAIFSVLSLNSCMSVLSVVSKVN